MAGSTRSQHVARHWHFKNVGSHETHGQKARRG
jgi:hypothetical protein